MVRPPIREWLIVAASAVDARIASAQRRMLATKSEVARMQRRDPSAQALADDTPGNVGDALDREPELLEDGSGGAEAPKWSSPTIAPSSPTQRS